MKGKAGFTLMEIMVSLVLVGLIAGIAGTSVITATRSYLYARENDTIAQKAQLALGRLNRELTELSTVKDASSTCVVYEGPHGKRAVARGADSNAIYLFTDYNSNACPASASAGDILVDGVQTFQILYNPNPSGTASLWNTSQSIRDLFAVRVAMELTRTDTGGTIPFYLTVSPRNNNNSGGAALPTTSNPPPEYSGRQCFVTTAAWGDANHPVVEALRQFRDRVLLQASPGRALVRLYEDVGPSLAQAIEGRPFACLLVRLLVTPVAGFAVVALTCPLLIPLILFLSWWLACLAVRAMHRRPSRRLPRLQRQRGAMLVTLIAALVIFSALGAVMIAMFGTAALSQASGNRTQRAYYMAESGFRYAAGAFLNVIGASESARESARDNLLASELHGKTFSLSSGDGAFALNVYPYFYKVTEKPTISSPYYLKTKVTGGFPLKKADYDDIWVQVKNTDGIIQYAQVDTVALVTASGYNELGFWKYSGAWDTSINIGAEVTPALIPNRATLTVTDVDGDGLIDYIPFLTSTGATGFPLRNGIFSVTLESGESRLLSYRELDVANTRLKGIGDPNGMPLTSLKLKDPGTGSTPANFIALTKYVLLESIGTFGTGSAAVSRKVTYYVPIGYARASPIPKTEFKESFDDPTLANWFTGVHGSHIGEQSQSSSIGPALQFGSGAVTKTGSGTRYYEGQIALNWSAANVPLPIEWDRASKYLSYDLQAKLYLQVIMAKQAAGLTFRLDESGNAMGLSFGVLDQGVDEYGRDKDYIPDSIVSGSISNPVIALWAKQYDKADSTFTVVTNPNAGATECTGQPERALSPYSVFATNSAVWETGFRVRFTPAGGAALPGGLLENTDYFVRKIEGTYYFYLFSSYYDAVAKDGSTPACWLWDRVQKITSPGSGTVTAVNQDPAWMSLAYQALTTGNSMYGLYNTALGTLTPWSTFLVRLIEAPSVSVLSTASSTGREIVSGDTVYTTSDNSSGGTITAIARVRRNPVYRSSSAAVRDWSAKTAQAVLILEPMKDGNGATRSHVFGQGKTLFAGIEGSGVNSGVVGIPSGSTDIVYRDRDQWITVYVADPTGPASSRIPDADPFNIYNTSTDQYLRGRILRTSVRWPVDDVENTTAANDFFTVVRFKSFVNSTLASCKVSGGSGLLELGGTNCLGSFYSRYNDLADYPDVLRFTSPNGTVFNSPMGSSFPTARPEVGLHNLGGNIPSFDDFAVQFGPGYGITRQGFLLPIQQ